MKKIICLCLLLFVAACSNSSSTPAAVVTSASYSVTSNGSVSYSVNGATNPTLSLQRGQTYTFNVSATGHPFFISTSSGTNTGNTYSDGVTGNNVQSGTLTFVVPAAAPNTLYYNCTLHSSMGGILNITN